MLHDLAYIFISPLNQSAFLILVGFCLLKLFKRSVLGKSLIWLSLFWLALCSQYSFSNWLIAPLENIFPPIQASSDAWQNASAIWVLACYHYDAETLPSVSQVNQCSLERLVHAANMYKVKRVPIYLTGGKFNKNAKKSHADIAAKLLVKLGVNVDDIVLVAKGTNTMQEALAVSTQIGQLKLAVISSATHGLRISKILDSLNIDYTFIPVHFATKGESAFTIHAPAISSLLRCERAMYEYGALAKHWINSR